MKYFKNMQKYLSLLRELIIKNIKLQYRNSMLGVLWTFLQPLLTTLILVLVFGRIFGKDDSLVLNYPVYLLSGRLIFEFYSQSTKKAMRSILANASIIKKVYVPKYMYPLSCIISSFFNFLISLTVLVLVMAYYILFTDSAINLTPYIFLSAVPLALLFVFSMGVGMILATLEVFFRDIEYLYDLFCMLLFYATPVFYNLEQLAPTSAMAVIFKLNPLYSFISMFRSSVLFGEMFSMNQFYFALIASFSMLMTGFAVFYKKQHKFILHI